MPRAGVPRASLLRLYQKVENTFHSDSWDQKDDSSEDKNEMALTVMNELNELALKSLDTRKDFSKIFIADTGASGYMIGSTRGMTNLRKYNDSVVHQYIMVFQM